jgi:hypothetical protein
MTVEELRRRAFEHARDMASELKVMATENEAPILAHLFDMAREEARLLLEGLDETVRQPPDPRCLLPANCNDLPAPRL